jgi:hypothetical protein
MNTIDHRALWRYVTSIAAVAIILAILRHETVISLRLERTLDSVLVAVACVVGGLYLFKLMLDASDDDDASGPPLAGA